MRPINIKKLQERENYSEYEEYSHNGKKLRGIFTKLKTKTIVHESSDRINSILREYGKTERSRLQPRKPRTITKSQSKVTAYKRGIQKVLGNPLLTENER
jgi:hypothetical protein